MGYFLDIITQPDIWMNFEQIIERLHTSFEGIEEYYEDDFEANIDFPGISGYVCIYKNEEKRNSGIRGYIRLFSNSYQENTLRYFAALAEIMGCKIGDGFH